MKLSKVILLRLMVIMFPLIGTAQVGIQFEHSLSWQEIQQRALKENKYIFIDCFATWCKPCKFMNDSIFSRIDVGDFFNDKFISVQIQFDTTKFDNDYIKRWYQSAKSIFEKYKVSEFPSYLFLSSQGQLVGRVQGANKNPDYFISKGKNAIEYLMQINQFNQGYKDSAFLKKLAIVTQGLGEKKLASKISKDYIRNLSTIYSKENLEFISRFTKNITDTGFSLLLKNHVKVDEIMGKNWSAKRVTPIISWDEIHPIIDKSEGSPNWTSIRNEISKKYQEFGEETLLIAQAGYYQKKKDWRKFGKYLLLYMGKYESRADDPLTLNSYAMAAFENCSDRYVLNAALEWAKKSILKEENYWNLDTYANLLYKLGKVKEAIIAQEKAVLLSKGSNREVCTNLDKMKSGEKTWK